MSNWQKIVTAPGDGKPVLLFLDPPLDTSLVVGYCNVGELSIVVGWNTGSQYRDGSLEWACGFCEEGSADTEGYSSAFMISVYPTHWMPLPKPPTNP